MHGLEAVPEGTELVAVHDGARPFVSPEVITKVILKAAKFGAAAPAIPVKDTIKVSKSGGVDETPDRKTLFAVQTPPYSIQRCCWARCKTRSRRGLR